MPDIANPAPECVSAGLPEPLASVSAALRRPLPSAPSAALPALQMLRSGPTTVPEAQRYLGRVPWASLAGFVAFDPLEDAPLRLTAAGVAALETLELELPPRPIPWPKALIAANVVARPSVGVARLRFMHLGRAALLAARECGVLHVRLGDDVVAEAQLTAVGATFRQDQPHRAGPGAVEASLARHWLRLVASVGPASLDHVAEAARCPEPYPVLHWLACAGVVALPAHGGDVVVAVTARGVEFLASSTPGAPEAVRAAA